MGNASVTASGANAHSHLSRDFPRLIVERVLPPGSGRSFRSYRVRRDVGGSPSLVCKVAVVRLRDDDDDDGAGASRSNGGAGARDLETALRAFADELRHLRDVLKDVPNVAPYERWCASSPLTAAGGGGPVVAGYLLRQHCHSTLDDRVRGRPFLTDAERTWIAYQLLRALAAVHAAGATHGNLTTENVCVTSWGWVLVTDVCPAARPTRVEDHDPRGFVRHYQRRDGHDEDGGEAESAAATNSGDHGGGRRGCYLAPERLRSERRRDGGDESDDVDDRRPAPSADVFSAGCVIAETYLDGGKILDLGDLAEYRQRGRRRAAAREDGEDDGDVDDPLPPSVRQRLNRVGSSNVRAACRHMLSLDPDARLSAGAYAELLEDKGVVPKCFGEFLWPFMARFRTPSRPAFWSHDARIALVAREYGRGRLRCLIGKDEKGEAYFRDVLGPAMFESKKGQTEEPPRAKESVANNHESDDVLAETNALLAELESLISPPDSIDGPADDDEDDNISEAPSSQKDDTTDEEDNDDDSDNGATSKTNTNNSPPSSPALVVLLQFVLSSIRHLQRPSTKLLALSLLSRFNDHVDDGVRLQRLLPHVVSLLDDPRAIVRARTVHVLADVVDRIRHLPPSDARLFPQYVLKRLAPAASPDENDVVRVALAGRVGRLAAAAQRFLDADHAMRMRDALLDNGGDARTSTTTTSTPTNAASASAFPDFPDDVARLLGSPDREEPPDRPDHGARASSAIAATSCYDISTDLIPNAYDGDLRDLRETFSTLLTRLASPSPSSSHVRRALLDASLSDLASFFGEDGTTHRLLPTVSTFWNEPRDRRGRATLCRTLPRLCRAIGRIGTEDYVLPMVENACTDGEDFGGGGKGRGVVVGEAVRCLDALIREGLLRGRTILLGERDGGGGLTNRSSSSRSDGNWNRMGILERYAALLLHPSDFVRRRTVSLFCSACRSIGFPDDEVFVLPILRPFLRYEPTREQLQSPDELESCLLPSVSRRGLEAFVRKLNAEDAAAKANKTSDNETKEAPPSGDLGDLFQSISIDDDDDKGVDTGFAASFSPRSRRGDVVDGEESSLENMRPYLDTVRRRHVNFLSPNKAEEDDDDDGPALNEDRDDAVRVSSAHSYTVPNQHYVERTSSNTIPGNYDELRAASRADGRLASEQSLLTSYKSIDRVYGLSVKGDASSLNGWQDNVELSNEEKTLAQDEIQSILTSSEAKRFDAALRGELGALATLDPSHVDARDLGARLRCTGLPALPPRLGVLRDTNGRPFSWHVPVSSRTERTSAEAILRNEWKPKADSLVMVSDDAEHRTAVVRLTVSQDQSYFVSASHDGTARVWGTRQIGADDSVRLRSSLVYGGHLGSSDENEVRLNDACIVENSHSVATAASNGSVHVWRVEMSVPKGLTSDGRAGSAADAENNTNGSSRFYETSRVSGSTLIRTVNPGEGEILAVNHFNTSTASTLTFATQRGIHSWDLRSAVEPFALPIRPELGYLTSMAVGTDRNWMVAGTNRGYLALWDLRFLTMVKLWQHSDAAPISRLATCFTTLPQDTNGSGEDRPFVFMGCGLNESAVFDVTNGKCRQCFRALDPALCFVDQKSLPRQCVAMPSLNEVRLPAHPHHRIMPTLSCLSTTIQHRRPPPEPSVQSIMGRIGKKGQSYVITGGSDRFIRYWDFKSVSDCYTVSGLNYGQPKPSYESVDVGSSGRLFLCRQAPIPRPEDVESSKLPRQMHRGPTRPDNSHKDAVLDLKNLEFPVKGLLSCSRDGVIKLWR